MRNVWHDYVACCTADKSPNQSITVHVRLHIDAGHVLCPGIDSQRVSLFQAFACLSQSSRSHNI